MTIDYKNYARCFINGEYVNDTETGFTLKNPANGQVVVEKVQEAGAKGGFCSIFVHPSSVSTATVLIPSGVCKQMWTLQLTLHRGLHMHG